MNKKATTTIRLLLLGESGVGKSSLLLRFTDDTFEDTYISTIGIDFRVKTVEIDGRPVKLQIWDTAGQERFRTITRAYYRGCQGIILVFDVSKLNTFNMTEYWMDEISKNTDFDVPKILVGNKSDLRDTMECVPLKQAQELAQTYGIDYFEVSAKNTSGGTPLHDVFIHLAKQVYDHRLYRQSNCASNCKCDHHGHGHIRRPSRDRGYGSEPPKRESPCCT
jgi:Ras-related protein Rab-1A